MYCVELCRQKAVVEWRVRSALLVAACTYSTTMTCPLEVFCPIVGIGALHSRWEGLAVDGAPCSSYEAIDVTSNRSGVRDGDVQAAARVSDAAPGFQGQVFNLALA